MALKNFCFLCKLLSFIGIIIRNGHRNVLLEYEPCCSIPPPLLFLTESKQMLPYCCAGFTAYEIAYAAKNAVKSAHLQQFQMKPDSFQIACFLNKVILFKYRKLEAWWNGDSKISFAYRIRISADMNRCVRNSTDLSWKKPAKDVLCRLL